MNTLLLIDLFYRTRFVPRTLLLLLTIIVLGSSHSTFASNQESASTRTLPLISAPKHVLVLFSYHRAEWSDNVQKGIESVFTPYQNVNFFYEYMDTKRLKTNEYLETLRKIYTEKYAEAHIDVVLCIDNNALDLLAENARTLFPGTPVVFCGINDYKPDLHATRPDVTGVVEYGDFADTLKIALRARPNATKLYIICNHTPTGETNTRDLIAALSNVAPGIQAVLTDRMSYEELSTTLQTAPPQQVAFFISFWKDGTGRNIQPWLLEAVFKKSAIPVFGRSEWMINHGMVGGKCVTGFAQGEAAGRIALQILSGIPVSDLPVDTNSPNQYLFDHRMMQHYLIDEDIFPDESIGFNRPEPFYRVSKPLGVTVLVFSALLLATLFFLAVIISQRRQALLALRKATASLEQSESRYRGMIENIQDTFYRTDARGFLIFISPSGARLLGYDSPQKMVGLPVASLWNFPAERSDMLEIMERDGVVRDYEVVLGRKDGSLLPVSTTSGYYHDKDGKLLGVEGIFRDITERKKAEEALLETEWKFRALFEKGPIGVAYHTMIYDISGKPIDYFFLDANESYKELTGVDPRGKTVTQAFPGIEGDPFDWIGTFGHVAQTGEQIRFEQYLQTNGQWYDCVAYQYKPDHFVAAFLNITKRKQAEEALKISSEKIQMFAYSVSHDLKNPAIALSGLTRLLSRRYLDILGERGQNYCQQILKSADQITTLVEMINTYISTKEISLEIESIKLVDLLLMIREEFEVSLNTRQIEWKAPELLPEIMADRIAILRVFRNFVDNALKYGGGDLSEIVIGYKEDDEHHILYVSDDGVGLTEEDSLNVFGLFERQKTASGIVGSGLGLAIVKEIAEQHGGQVWSETGSNKGIIFNVSISKHL